MFTSFVGAGGAGGLSCNVAFESLVETKLFFGETGGGCALIPFISQENGFDIGRCLIVDLYQVLEKMRTVLMVAEKPSLASSISVILSNRQASVRKGKNLIIDFLPSWFQISN